MCSIRDIESKKIVEINEKKTTFGRGPFLAVRDKRVSRNHGTIKQVGSGIEITSIHVNPCFYAKKSELDKWMKLDKDEAVVLRVGDIFSLLPKQYIYEVINDSKSESGNAESADIESTNISSNKTDSEPKKDIVKNNKHEKKINVEIKPTPEIDTSTKKSNTKQKISDTKLETVNLAESETVSQTTRKKEFPTPSKIKKMGTQNSFMDGEKEIAFPTEKKRKLPAWMLNQTKTPKNDSKNLTKTPKNKKSNAKQTPKSSTAKRRQKMPSVKFDSSDDEDITINTATSGKEIPKRGTQVKTKDEDSPKKAEPAVKKGKSLENSAKRTEVSIKKSPRRSPSNDTKISTPTKQQQRKSEIDNLEQTSENIEMVDVSIAAQTMNTSSNQMSPSKAFVDDVATTTLSNVSHPSGDDLSPPPQQGASNTTAPSPASTSNLLRSSCAFGSSCYRKNPTHFREFSHPGDADYIDPGTSDDDSNRPECPYGTSCYRKNPLHKKQYRHGKRVAPKRVAKIRAARKAARNDESSSDDYDFDDSFLNDDSDDDISDEDSDWNPSQNSEKQKKSTPRRKRKQPNYAESDSNDSTDEEDLSDLVSDAKKFATNRKMWKK
ncbi:aprataxin and PNK-like factor isoform X1 [Styela clava]